MTPYERVKELHDLILRGVATLGVADCTFGSSCKGGLFITGTPEACQGRFEVSAARHPFLFARGDVRVPGPCSLRFVGRGMARIKISLAGEGALAGFPSGERLGFAGETCLVVHVGDSDDLVLEMPRDGRQCGLTMWLPRGVLSGMWGFDATSLPQPFADLEREGSSTPRGIAVPLRPALAAAALSVMHCALAPPLLDLFLEAKARELCVSLIDALWAAEREPYEPALPLSERDFAKITRAHRLVSAVFSEPPSIAQLARQVGLNRNKLCVGFRSRFGASIHDYCRELRLQRALVLLQKRSVAITEVALEVGYEHAPAFSTAFKRRFGCTPKEYRARGVMLP